LIHILEAILNVVSLIVIEWVEEMEMAFFPNVRFPPGALA
jgi:hypothetical protein